MQEAAALYDDFADFIKSHRTPADGEPLEEFILEWLEHGDAVIESGGDFGTYLKGVILIIVRWLENPAMLDFEGNAEDQTAARRRASGVLRQDSLGLDRDYFRTVLMRRLVKRE